MAPSSSDSKKSIFATNCVVLGCKSKRGQSESIAFFEFPSDIDKLVLWCSNAKRHDLALMRPESVRNRYKICSLHFENSMFTNDARDTLVDGAIPTMFHNTNSEGIYPCAHCPLTYTSRTAQANHDKYCRGKNKPKPAEEIADTESINGSEVLDLTPKPGPEKPSKYSCTMCSYSTGHKTAYTKHQQMHSGVKPYKCSFCDYRCVQKGNLRRHEKIHTGVKPFECYRCDYKCSERGHMKTHLLIHSGDKPYSCNLCAYKSTLSGNLKRHLSTHTGEKKYECKVCGYKCREACNLRDHIMTHSGQKPHQCGECGYRCTQASNLKTHMRVHTGFTPYVCSECAYKTTRAGNLRDHMRTHTGERPHKCPNCDYRAAQRSHLRNHMKTHMNSTA